MMYVYCAIGGVFAIESFTIWILFKINKNNKYKRNEAETKAETYKTLLDKTEYKYQDILQTLKELREGKNEKIDIPDDIDALLHGV